MTNSDALLTCTQKSSVKLHCEVDLHKLFVSPIEKERFNSKWEDFIGTHGKVLVFQKNAWNGLKSDSDPAYNIIFARDGTLIGRLKGTTGIQLLAVPPTRLSGPCSRVLKLLISRRIRYE